MARVKGPFADPKRPTGAELRRWQAGYRAASVAQAQQLQRAGVDRARARAVSRDLLDAALAPGNRIVFKDAVRQRGETAVREIWKRLRAAHAPAKLR
jgi:hypothetical protein